MKKQIIAAMLILGSLTLHAQADPKSKQTASTNSNATTVISTIESSNNATNTNKTKKTTIYKKRTITNRNDEGLKKFKRTDKITTNTRTEAKNTDK